MPNPRIKLPPTIINRARGEEILGEIAQLKIAERDQSNALDAELTAVRERFTGPLAALGKQIEEKTALLERWADANPEEFPRGRKSVELLHGTVGYRTGTPKLKLLPRHTWDVVLEGLKTLAKSFPGWVRVKEEVNKEAILSAHSQGSVTEEVLKRFGVKVVQEETFFVEPKLQELEARECVEVK